LKVLLDVHVPLSLARALIEDEHDVVRAAAAHADWSDARLLALAVADGFVIVTEDSDFSELIFGKGHDAPPSIFYLQATQVELPGLIQQVRLVIESDRFANHMVAIRRSNIRYRAFPGKQKNG